VSVFFNRSGGDDDADYPRRIEGAGARGDSRDVTGRQRGSDRVGQRHRRPRSGRLCREHRQYYPVSHHPGPIDMPLSKHLPA
jgi:hypothetical protein